MQITTRVASLEDVDFLVGLLGERHRPDALDQVHGRIENSITYVVRVDDQTVGRLRLVRTGHHIEIAGIQVDPKRRGQGWGPRSSPRSLARPAQVVDLSSWT